MDPKFAERIRGVLKTPGREVRGFDVDEAIPALNGASDAEPGSREDDRHLEQTLRGQWRKGDGAQCFVVETRWDEASKHGAESMATMASRLADAVGDVPLVAGSGARPPFVFFDLETTGLSGGAGTYAFLVGCGWFDEAGGFVTRQYLLATPSDEPGVLASVAGELGRAGALVSFNGKSFDAPVLETRYLFHRLEWVGAGVPHLDMLHVARRFWGKTPSLSSEADGSGCSLIALERQILGTPRHGDVPSFEIPSRYFHFVRTGDARPLGRVFEHNRLDLLSLAALTSRMLHLVRRGPRYARDAREALALGHVYSRAGLEGRALDAYRWAVDLGGHDTGSRVHLEALRALALALRRSRRYQDAAGCWQRILDVRDCPPHVAREASEALAIHHEHRIRDFWTAKAFALRGLQHGAQPAWAEAVRHRVARIEKKMSGASGLLNLE